MAGADDSQVGQSLHVSDVAAQSASRALLPDDFSAGRPCVRAFRISEVCRVTGLGRTTIYAAIGAGDLIARKYRRVTLVLETDLADFLSKLRGAK